MKLPPPQRRAQLICLAMALYFMWGVYDELFGVKVFQPKALVGSMIGSIIFLALGFPAKPGKKQERLPEKPASPPDDVPR